MGARISITTSARKDFFAIVSYIAGESPAAGEKIGREIAALFVSLEKLPTRGKQSKKYPGVHNIVHRQYLIFYRFIKKDNTVLILRVWDTRQNPKRFTLN